MAEREIIGDVNALSEDAKQGSNQEALRIANEANQKTLISDKHGMLKQEALMALSDQELLNRFVEIADRGFVAFRLKVPMPSDWYGEWFANDPQSIAEAHMKGFVVDDKFAVNHGLHSDATGKPIVGDVIHMICPKRIKDMHDMAAKVRYNRVHGKKKNLPEETGFEGDVKTLGLDTVHQGKSINTSSQESANRNQILNAIKG